MGEDSLLSLDPASRRAPLYYIGSGILYVFILYGQVIDGADIIWTHFIGGVLIYTTTSPLLIYTKFSSIALPVIIVDWWSTMTQLYETLIIMLMTCLFIASYIFVFSLDYLFISALGFMYSMILFEMSRYAYLQYFY